MRQKWTDSRGETLIEVLASILIGALSVALLFSAVMTSNHMGRRAKATDTDFYAILSKAEAKTTPYTLPPKTADGSTIESKVTVANDNISSRVDVNVQFYGGEGALSYSLKQP